VPPSLVTFSAHAMDRMRQRGISELQVLATLAKPDRMYLGSHGNPIAERTLGRTKVLRVVFVERASSDGRQTHVVTAMWK
jgi:hypothetical protein